MRILLKNCDILAYRDGNYETIRGGALSVLDDTIEYIGTEAPAGNLDRVLDLDGAMVLPGLVNTHCHAAMTLLRGVGSGLPLQNWLFDTVFPIEDRLTPALVKAGGDLALLEMIASGTTSFSDMYFFPMEMAESVLASGIKANICRPVQSFDPSETPDQCFRIGEAAELFRRYHNAGNGRLRVDFCIHAEYTCTPQVVEAASALCKEHGGRMHIHLSETESEHQACIRKYGKTPARWFYDLGTFDSPTAAAHCVWVTEEDLALFQEKGVSPIHDPASNMKLGSGYAPIRRMLDLGLNVALGTDGAASNNNLNLVEEMHLAALLHNGYHRDPTMLQPEDVFRMATLNGARLQGREDTGALAVGKKADLIAVSTQAPHMMPAFEAIPTAVYTMQGSDVVLNMVDGQVLYENGQFLTLDAEKIKADFRQALRELYPR